MLAALLVHAGRVVSLDQLIDELWPTCAHPMRERLRA
ncbi:MAG: winged helix-turn-helix domain-containing protein [Pseudonocardia sp.]|nr:winged helix-turn-helix domain-containing protein [Pseudonocardia sp.]